MCAKWVVVFWHEEEWPHRDVDVDSLGPTKWSGIHLKWNKFNLLWHSLLAISTSRWLPLLGKVAAPHQPGAMWPISFGPFSRRRLFWWFVMVSIQLSYS